MSCKNECKLCRNLVISTAVAFDAATNTLNITLPESDETNGILYGNGCKVCFIVAQTIPATTTITALVNIIIGGSTFPLQRCNCTQATACEIRTRTRYATCIVTNSVSGAFRLIGKTYTRCPESLSALPIEAAAAGAANEQ